MYRGGGTIMMKSVENKKIHMALSWHSSQTEGLRNAAAFSLEHSGPYTGECKKRLPDFTKWLELVYRGGGKIPAGCSVSGKSACYEKRYMMYVIRSPQKLLWKWSSKLVMYRGRGSNHQDCPESDISELLY